MSTNDCSRIIEDLKQVLDHPWNDIADFAVEAFEEIARQHCVSTLVSAVLPTESIRTIRSISFFLAHVELYQQEISILYHWIDSVLAKLDEHSMGALTTAIQRHIAILAIELPMAPAIEQVMIPFLLNSLTAFDWTTRNAAVVSFDMLDGLRQLDKWLASEQLAELRQNLQVHLQLEKEQGNTPHIGRLKRFAKS